MARPTKDVQMLSQEIGQPITDLISNYVRDTKQATLRMPERLCVYDAMDFDGSVFAPRYASTIRIIDALYKGTVKANTKLGKEYADRINYCLKSFSYGTWLEALRDAETCNKYGFSILNMVVEYRPGNGYCLRKLSPRDQKTIAGWLWDENYQEVIGLVQKQNTKNAVDHGSYKPKESFVTWSGKVDSAHTVLKRNQYLHFTCDATSRNPQGESPYYHAYTAYAEKNAFQKLELIGAGKDLGGLYALYLPDDLLAKAAKPTDNPVEAANVKNILDSVAKIQDGRSSVISLPSGRDDKGYLRYEIQIKGIDGAGKQYSTSEIIESRKKDIYNCFGAGHLLLGQNGSGSNALFNGADLRHTAFCEHKVAQMVDVINTQLIPRLLAVNGIYPTYQDMPFFEAADLVGISWDEFGKIVQRFGSVDKLTPDQYEFLANLVPGMPKEGIAELDYSSHGDSKAGTGLGTSGQGARNQNNSSLNLENKSLNNFVLDGDKIVDTETDQVVDTL